MVNFKFFKGNVRSSSLELSSEEVIFFLELVDDRSFKYLIGIFILDFEIKIVIMKGKFSLILIELFIQIFHLFVSRFLHFLQHMLLVVIVLFLQIS